MCAALSTNGNDGGFRNPAAPGLTRSLRINRQGPRGVTGSNTGDGEQAHDQKRVSPFWGGATIQGSREKYQQFDDDGFRPHLCNHSQRCPVKRYYRDKPTEHDAVSSWQRNH